MAVAMKSNNKEEWMHWTPGEIKVIAVIAYCYNPMMDEQTHIAAKHGKKGEGDEYKNVAYFQEHTTKRPFLPYERYTLAARKLARIYDETNRQFEVAMFDFSCNRVTSEAFLDPKRTAESKSVYMKLIEWDENFLKELSSPETPYSIYCEKIGFQRHEPIPILEERLEGSDIEKYLEETGTDGKTPQEVGKHETMTATIPDAPKKRPGRPRKSDAPE